jgi:hypothetical protein
LNLTYQKGLSVHRLELVLATLVLFAVQDSSAQRDLKEEKVDSVAIARILEEGTQHSQVMELLSYISDVYGPRLTGSPGFKRGAEWAKDKLTSWGLENPHLEGWGPFGRGWELERYSAHVIGPQVFPLLSYPKAWSPGTNGTVQGDVILCDAKTDSALETFRGKLKDKFVLIGGGRPVKVNFESGATRLTDAQLLELANAEAQRVRRRRQQAFQEFRARAMVEYKKQLMCLDEGAAALLTAASFDGGSISVLSASVPTPPDTPRTRRIRVWNPKAPKILPQLEVAVEHYNRMVRMIEKGERLRIEMDLSVKFFKEDSGYNVIAELPGTDLKDEVVMIGAHLDSWHGGTGATDDGSGVAVCMETMRILKTLGLKPRRTIRVALWGGEEQGELGSRAYVRRHFVQNAADGDAANLTMSPEGEKFSVYFNDDNGTGKFRGLFMEGNDAVRPIFRKWFATLDPLGSYTLTMSGTGSTDHAQFNAVGLPGFQFVQDDIEYFTRTWHSTMDLYDRAMEDDLKQGVVTMASFAYNAAMRDQKFPRKP